MNPSQRMSQIVLPILILLVGIAIFAVLVHFRQAPVRKEQPDPGALVHLLTVQPEDYRLRISATGTVQPQQEVSITPQVSGLVDWVAPECVAGGFLRKGALLFSIEASDQRLLLERAAAGVAQAEVALATAEARARVAKKEWEALNGGETPASPLVLHEPQIREAQAALAAARAARSQAELDLARTRVFAPFNCRVRSEQLAPGQYVKSGSPVALVAGIDLAEIIVPIPLEDLAWLVVPKAGGRRGSAAEVSLTVGGLSHRWQGWVSRSLGEVDEKGRMARLVVAVPDPHGQKGGNDARPELAANLFVDLQLTGLELRQVYVLPREALREKNTVWLMDQNQRLRIRPVSVKRLERERAIVDGGLSPGEELVLTQLVGAADGMLLRPATKGGGR